MIDEPIGLTFRDHVGIDKIMWECDYPHCDSTWPHSQKAVDELFVAADVDRDEAEAIHARQRRALFRWELGVGNSAAEEGIQWTFRASSASTTM